jgi:TPP-dependent trihydroxycyclohexane-1,2-dione (THcHDO) dehydratase
MTAPDTRRLTVAQAVVTYLSRQYSVADGQRRRLIPATLGVFGHGNVAGLGQALDQLSDVMPFIQGRNEQALVHAATAFAKHSRRHATLAVTSSIGPGALNMVTGAALATVNRLPVLLLPGDTYATRHQGPVLQQLQHPLGADVTVNDAFRPVCRFFDRITRPEQLLTALPAAMRVLTDPADAGAVVLSLPQDIQSCAYDWPAGFFAGRDWVIRRPQPDRGEVGGTDAVLTQGQLIGVLQEHARPGDVVIAAAGGPPGDLLKVWDATEGRHCHLEFGFSCMGYEIPAAIGVRLAEPVTPGPAARVISFLGDGTFLLAPTELVTAAAEGLAVTLVVPDNHGYQVIHRLQMLRSGREFGNEFRYRPEPLQLAAGDGTEAPRLEGDYLRLDLVQVATGLGARACRATTAAELRDALSGTRDHPGPVVIVVPVIPHADLPGAGVWWDVAPAEVSALEVTAGLRSEYEADLAGQRWFG